MPRLRLGPHLHVRPSMPLLQAAAVNVLFFVFISAMVRQKWILLAILAITTTAESEPSCKFYGEQQTDLICTPGLTDYELKRGLVSDNNRTTGITLRGCRITSVELEAFERLFALKYLDLSINKIEELELGVLDEALQVTYLNLSYNMISELPLGIFDQKPNVEVLDLKANRLRSLELGIFDPLHKLRYVDLSRNAFTGRNFNAYIFDQSKKIEVMYFSDNNMSGAPDELLHAFEANDFKYLELERCSLTEVPKFLGEPNLSNLKQLMLSSNHISKLDDATAFSKLMKLETLNLYDNMIESVSEDVFKPLKKLKMIILRYNRLKNLPETLFQNMMKLGNIDLSHNLIEYVPVSAFRGTALKNLNLSDNKFTYLTDNFVLELRNSGTRLTKFFFNENPFQCACLKQVLDEVKSFKVEYNSVKYNGKDAVCVTTSEFNCKRNQEFNSFYVEMYNNLVKN